jgi:hypothetical protein
MIGRALLAAVLTAWSSLAAAAVTGLPFQASFERGDFSEWQGGLDSTLTVVSGGASDGNFFARSSMTRGQTTDNYKEYVFGDHPRVGGLPVTRANGLWLEFDSKFDAGFSFSSQSNLHKIAILNLEDENSRRRYQVIVNVWTASGEYFVEHLKWNADRSFNRAMPNFGQNVGAPLAVRYGQWDRLKLFVRPNTPGMADGIVRFWVNGVLKADYSGVNLREDTSYNINKLLLSNYVPVTDVSGFQSWDNFVLSESEPLSTSIRPRAPVLRVD